MSVPKHDDSTYTNNKVTIATVEPTMKQDTPAPAPSVTSSMVWQRLVHNATPEDSYMLSKFMSQASTADLVSIVDICMSALDVVLLKINTYHNRAISLVESQLMRMGRVPKTLPEVYQRARGSGMPGAQTVQRAAYTLYVKGKFTKARLEDQLATIMGSEVAEQGDTDHPEIMAVVDVVAEDEDGYGSAMEVTKDRLRALALEIIGEKDVLSDLIADLITEIRVATAGVSVSC